jgi:hypothetical protein
MNSWVSVRILGQPLTLNLIFSHRFTIFPIVDGNFFSISLFQNVKGNIIGDGSCTDVQTEAEPY